MKNLLNKIRFERLNIAALAMAFVCAGMWGCSDDVSFDWSETRSDREIAAFVDDSFVVVTDTRRWLESTEGWNGSYSESYGCGNDRMCIYNYRVQEDGPRWCDSIETESGSYHWHQLTDSIVWSGSPWDGAGSFIKLWKIGEKPAKYELKVKKDGCKRSFMPNSYKQWLDGKFIGKNGESFDFDGEDCQYIVLDTVKNTLTYKRFDEDLKWVEKCDDVRAWGEDVYCLIFDKVDGNSVMLKNAADTIEMPRIFAIGGFWGDVLKLSGRLCSFKNDVANCADVTWYGNEIKFYRDDGIIVEY